MKMKTKLIGVRVDDELDRKIGEISKRTKQSKSNILRLALERGLGPVADIFVPPKKRAA